MKFLIMGEGVGRSLLSEVIVRPNDYPTVDQIEAKSKHYEIIIHCARIWHARSTTI
jgi:hypothetical protein